MSELMMLMTGMVVVTSTAFLAAVAMIAKWYHKPRPDEALIRTGSGGERVAIGTGIMSIPVLHELTRLSLRHIRFDLEDLAICTKDQVGAKVVVEIVAHTPRERDSILVAARALGGDASPESVRALYRERANNAVCSVFANLTYQDAAAKLIEANDMIAAILDDQLHSAGLRVQSVVIKNFARSRAG